MYIYVFGLLWGRSVSVMNLINGVIQIRWIKIKYFVEN